MDSPQITETAATNEAPQLEPVQLPDQNIAPTIEERLNTIEGILKIQ